MTVMHLELTNASSMCCLHCNYIVLHTLHYIHCITYIAFALHCITSVLLMQYTSIRIGESCVTVMHLKLTNASSMCCCLQVINEWNRYVGITDRFYKETDKVILWCVLK